MVSYNIFIPIYYQRHIIINKVTSIWAASAHNKTNNQLIVLFELYVQFLKFLVERLTTFFNNLKIAIYDYIYGHIRVCIFSINWS